MSRKPTYEELEQRIRDLEDAESRCKKKEESLRQNRELYRRLVENSPAVMYQFRLAANGEVSFPFISKAIKDISNVSDEDVMRDPFTILDMMHPQSRSEFQEKLLQSASSLEVFTADLCVMVNKEAKWISVHATPQRQPDGSVVWDGFFNDITDSKRAEKALQESEENLKTILNSIGDAVIATDTDGKVTRMNPVAEKLTGWNNKSAQGKPLSEIFKIFSAKTGAKVENPVRKVLKNGQIVGLANHTKLISRNGKEYQIADSGSPIKNAEGQILGVVMVFRDVTEEYYKNEQIRETKELLHGIFQSIQDGISVLNPDLTIRYVNPVMEKWYAQSMPLVGKKCFRCYHNTSKPCDPCPTLRCLQTGQTEVEIVNGPPGENNEVQWIELFSYPMQDPSSGKIRGIVEFVRNITERKTAEEMLRENEEKFRIIFNTSPDAISLSSLSEGIYIEVNEGFTKHTGYTPEEVIGRPVHTLNIWKNKQDRDVIVNMLEKNSYVDNFEAEFVTKYGEIKTGLMSACMTEINGKPVMLAITKDISDHKKLQRQLLQAQKMEAIGTLAGGIAHNFNNILMGIQGRASLMIIDKNPSHPDYEHLKEIEHYVRNAVELTKALLGFARGGKYEVSPTDLNLLIKHESKMFGRMKKEIKIHEKYANNLWTVEVDQGQIRQTLLNLFVNAWQAMPNGGDLYIQTENVELDEGYPATKDIVPGRYVKISITDTGEGMDDETMQKIFDPFFSTKDVGQGSGLGLSSAYGIINNHGGFINVYSEKGNGSTFNLYLPASEKKMVRGKPEPRNEKLHRGYETILLVDDEDIIVKVGQTMLEKLGYSVLIAKSGEEALKIYTEKKDEIDLVILDMIMPGMGGGETFEQLKQIDKNVKVLLASGYSINGQAKEIIRQGCLGFIQKPFSLKQLSDKLKKLPIKTS